MGEEELLSFLLSPLLRCSTFYESISVVLLCRWFRIVERHRFMSSAMFETPSMVFIVTGSGGVRGEFAPFGLEVDRYSLPPSPL